MGLEQGTENKGKFILINLIMFHKFKYKHYRFIIIEYLVQRHAHIKYSYYFDTLNMQGN